MKKFILLLALIIFVIFAGLLILGKMSYDKKIHAEIINSSKYQNERLIDGATSLISFETYFNNSQGVACILVMDLGNEIIIRDYLINKKDPNENYDRAAKITREDWDSLWEIIENLGINLWELESEKLNIDGDLGGYFEIKLRRNNKSIDVSYGEEQFHSLGLNKIGNVLLKVAVEIFNDKSL